MGGAAAGDLHRILARPGQRADVDVRAYRRAGVAQPRIDPGGGGRFVEADRPALPAQHVERRPQRVRPLHRHLVAEMALQPRRQLARIDEQVDLAIGAQHREGQRQRRVRHVAAADVQQPGDGVGRRDHRGIDAGLVQFRTQRGALVMGALAGIGHVMGHHRGQRHRRPVGPHRIDRVLVHRHQHGPDRLQRRLDPLDPVDGVQPRVVAEPAARRHRPGQPVRVRVVDQVQQLEHRTVGLVRHLQRVAPVHEQRRAVAQHDRQTGRTGEPADPGQALRGRRHALALMGVGARDHETVEADGREPPAQGRHTVGQGRSMGAVGGGQSGLRGAQAVQHIGAGVRRHQCQPAIGVASVRCRVDTAQQIAQFAGRDRQPGRLGQAGESRVIDRGSGHLGWPPVGPGRGYAAAPPAARRKRGAADRGPPGARLARILPGCMRNPLCCNAKSSGPCQRKVTNR